METWVQERKSRTEERKSRTEQRKSRSERPEPGSALVAAVAAHVTFSLIHGLAHLTIPVRIAAWQSVFSVVVLFVIPVAGAGLVRSGHVRTGGWVVLAAGLVGLAFESVLHFGVPNPDYVASVDHGVRFFASTAGLSVAGDILLVTVAGWTLRRHAQGSPATSCIDSTT